MAETTWRGAVIRTPTPPPLTPERRAALEAARWWNTSLDEAMAELDRVEARQKRALEILAAARHFVGYEDELVQSLKDALGGP